MSAEKHRYAARDDMRWFHAHHFCISCKKKDAFTLAGRWRCAECAAEWNRRAKERRAEDPERAAQENAKSNQARKDRVASGLCRTCGTPIQPGDNHKLCPSCRAKERERQRRKRVAAGILPRSMWPSTVCVQCGQPVGKGKTVWGGNPRKQCDRCYALSVFAAARGRAAYMEKYGKSWGEKQGQFTFATRKEAGE